MTAHQLKRIRRADAADIARMVDQERYWFPESLREILRRIDSLNNQEPQEALAAGHSALRILDRIRDASADLQAVTFATHASTLRCNGQPQAALSVYKKTLKLEELSKVGRGDVLTKMAVTLTCLGEIREGLKTIETALITTTDRVQALAIRGWIRFADGNLASALTDCMTVLDLVKASPRSDYSAPSAITTACNVLSFETGLDVDPAIFRRLEKTIAAYREIYPSGGSGYYKVRRPRLMLSRAEALVFMRTGRAHQAVAPLERAIHGLVPSYPDDAFAAALDLVCAYAQIGRSREAAVTLATARELLKRVPFSIKSLARNALKAAIESNNVRYGEAVELRCMLRSPHIA